MHPDLEAVVAADEEGRARLATAEQRRDAALTAARNESEAAVAGRRAAALAMLNDEIGAIRRDGDARAAEARARNAEYLRLLAAAGEDAIEEAVGQYTRIVFRP